MKVQEAIEPGAVSAFKKNLSNVGPQDMIAMSLLSIAISQKRQADSMDRMESAGMVTPETMSDLLHDFKHG